MHHIWNDEKKMYIHLNYTMKIIPKPTITLHSMSLPKYPSTQLPMDHVDVEHTYQPPVKEQTLQRHLEGGDGYGMEELKWNGWGLAFLMG